MPWYRVEIQYDDEIEAENEDVAHEVFMGKLRKGDLDVHVDICELHDNDI